MLLPAFDRLMLADTTRDRFVWKGDRRFEAIPSDSKKHQKRSARKSVIVSSSGAFYNAGNPIPAEAQCPNAPRTSAGRHRASLPATAYRIQIERYPVNIDCQLSA
jgi:hypothetical protein